MHQLPCINIKQWRVSNDQQRISKYLDDEKLANCATFTHKLIKNMNEEREREREHSIVAFFKHTNSQYLWWWLEVVMTRLVHLKPTWETLRFIWNSYAAPPPPPPFISTIKNRHPSFFTCPLTITKFIQTFRTDICLKPILQAPCLQDFCGETGWGPPSSPIYLVL